MVKARFTLADIQEKALAIVDGQGLASLTMRSLAAALGTGPMTLYNYVADKGALEELVVDAVVSGITIPQPTGDWLVDVAAVARAVWRAVRDHPGAIPLVLTRRSSSTAAYGPAEALIAALRTTGLPEQDVLTAFRAVLAFVMGLAQVELTNPPGVAHGEPDGTTEIHRLAQADHPNIARMALLRRDSDPDVDFEQGLALLLRGIGAARE